MDLHDLDVRINKAGVALTAASNALGALGLPASAVAPMVAALQDVDAAQRDIQAWSNGAKPKGTGGSGAALPPGMVVVDVGDAGDRQGHGSIRAADMSPANWAYYQQHNLGPQWAAIFSDTLDEVNAAIGVLPGNLTQYGDGDPNVGNWTLASFG